MEKDLKEKLLLGEAEGSEEKLSKRVWVENKKLWVVAGPAIFSRFSTFGVSIITQAFIGHLGSTEFAAYAIVFTVLLRFAISIQLVMSLSSAKRQNFWIQI
ncbi:protein DETOXIFICATION 20-like [Asparagus officinalis]|uniref:protein DETOXIFICATION 20-like n=1 Tax=Asparagus officinalis TaxID=4686 RepID=UPI00098E5B9A|nr:protein DETOXIFICATION 20-like [Asparagus officinalis]